MRTKDRPLLLRRALDSVLAQAWAHWHLYLVNDGGDPAPVEALLEERAAAFDGRITVVRHASSVGMEAASNAGLRVGGESYVAIHDDDDSWSPNFLERSVAFLEANGDRFAGVVTHTVRIMEEIRGDTVFEISRDPGFNVHLRAITLAQMAQANQYPPISFLYRRKVLEALGGYDESMPVLGDWEFNLRFVNRYDIGVIEAPLAFWHNRGGQGAQASSVIAALKTHLEYDSLLRNRMLRGGGAMPSEIGVIAGMEKLLAPLREQAADIQQHMRGAHAAEKEKAEALQRADGLARHVAALEQERQAVIHAFEKEKAEALQRADGLARHVAALEQERQAVIHAFHASLSWRLTAPVRLAGRLLGRLRGRGAAATPSARPAPLDYDAWICAYDDPSLSQLAAVRRRAVRRANGLRFVALLPGGDEDSPAARSLRAQSWPSLRLVFDTAPDLAALEADWIVHLPLSAEAAPYALAVLALAIADEAGAALVYGDADRLDAEDRRRDPLFKPDWNQEWMLAADLTQGLVAWRRAEAVAAGGWNSGMGSAAAYDLGLRLAALAGASRCRHLPYILCHRRDDGPLPEDGRAALAGHLARRAAHGGMAGEALAVESGWRPRHALPAAPPLVTAIIPTKDCADLLEVCLDGLLNGTDWPNLEVLIVDNGSTEAASFALFDRLRQDSRVRILRIDRPFNFAALNNAAAAEARGELLLFLNNDIEVIEPGWLAEMARLALCPDVGLVGAKLLYADRTMQHAGVLVGKGGIAGHMLHRLPEGAPGPDGRARRALDLSAVTAACMLGRAALYRDLNGMEEKLAVAFNDTDYCLRVWEAGYRVVWTPFACLLHHESVSRGEDVDPRNRARLQREAAFMKARWGEKLIEDRFFSPNYDIDAGDGRLAAPPRIPRPWQP